MGHDLGCHYDGRRKVCLDLGSIVDLLRVGHYLRFVVDLFYHLGAHDATQTPRNGEPLDRLCTHGICGILIGGNLFQLLHVRVDFQQGAPVRQGGTRTGLGD